ncbi:hypothetical protein GGF37_005358, partial [Kickxella alabastrina]
AYLNKVILMGNVGADPQEITFSNGKKMATFSLATSRRYKDAEGNTLEHTSWHRIKVSGDNAERVMNYVKKSALVQVEGSIRYDTYTNKDGAEVHVTNINADSFNIVMFPKREEAAASRDEAE